MLKMPWEEAQELLRPAPSAKSTIVMIEDYEFEEYDVSLLSFHCFCSGLWSILSGWYKRHIIVHGKVLGLSSI
jgi:hypothetical protein